MIIDNWLLEVLDCFENSWKGYYESFRKLAQNIYKSKRYSNKHERCIRISIYYEIVASIANNANCGYRKIAKICQRPIHLLVHYFNFTDISSVANPNPNETIP